MLAARSILRSLVFSAGGLLISQPSLAAAYEAMTTQAGLTQQAALTSLLHRRLLQRFVHPLGLFEPLRLDLSMLPERRARDLYGRLVGLDPAEGYAPEWQTSAGHIHPLGRQHVLGWLAAGTVIESSPPERLSNHFLDPKTGLGLHTPDGQSSTDTSLLAVKSGVSSVRQLLAGAAIDGNGFSATEWVAAPEKVNDLGLQAFLRAYERAEGAELPAERETALAETLLIVGGMLGVLEQMGDPAYLRSDLRAVLDGAGEAAVSARFARAGVPAPAAASLDTVSPPLKAPSAELPHHLSDLFRDGQGGGLAERTVHRCDPATARGSVRCYTTEAPALLAEVGLYAQRLIDYLFRGELRLSLSDGGHRLDVVPVELPLGSGTVTLLGEQPGGQRRVLRTAEVLPTLTGASLVQFAISDDERKTLHRLVVLFRGRDRANEPLVTSAQLLIPLSSEVVPTP